MVEIGFIFSVASVVPPVLQVIGGWLSDSIGRLRTIAIGSLGGCLGYFGLVLAPSWQWAMAALCVEFISGSVVGPSFGAFIAEQSAEENRGRVFGLSKGLFLVVGVAGPLLGGFLAQRYGFRAMLLVAAATYASATALRVWMAGMARFVGTSVPHRPTLASFRTNMASMVGMLMAGGVLTWILITDGVRDVAFNLSGQLQPLYLSEVGGMSTEQICWLRAPVGLLVMSATVPAGWLSDRRGERVTIASGFFLQSLGITIFLQSSDLAAFAAAAVVFGLGIGTMIPAYDVLVSKAVPERMRGIAFGLFQTSLGVISLPAPWVAGQLWERFGPRMPFALTAAAAFIAILPVWFKFRLSESRPERMQGEGQGLDVAAK